MYPLTRVAQLFLFLGLANIYAQECALSHPQHPPSPIQKEDSRYWTPPLLPPAYNAPVSKGLQNPWNVNFWGTCIYWQPIQENMELGSIEVSSAPSVSFVPHEIINMDFAFKPGFQVGVGGTFGPDHWDLQTQYTWFHNTNNETSYAPTGSALLPAWVVDVSIVGTYTSASEMWQLSMDIADLDLGRWYYVGSHLLFHPTFGVRALWLEQDNQITYLNTSSNAVIPRRVITGSTRSWGVGGKASLKADWMIGKGFHLYGIGEGDLLFTDYTRLQAKDENISPATNVATINDYVKQNDVYAIKPHVDLEIGLGWGAYVAGHRGYLDLEIGYGFQVFFNQNMFRHYGDDVNAANGFMPNGNLYIQGFTAKLGLEF